VTLRLGIIECDHVDAAFSSIAGDYRDMFARLLATTPASLDLVPYSVCTGELPASAKECDAWLATGSRRSVYEPIEWIQRTTAFVADIAAGERPYVGVCFGHQLLAQALGGRVERADAWGAGVHEIDIAQREPWIDPPADRCRLAFMHQDQVVALPDGAVVIGSTDHCPIACFRVGTMLGVQAHPEFDARYALALLDHRVERIGSSATATARASLLPPAPAMDAEVMARWFVNFLGAVA
jgi:GMP synthase-like glutamine amidotransferase